MSDTGIYWAVPKREIFEKIEHPENESVVDSIQKHMTERWGENLDLNNKIEWVHASGTYNIIKYTGWENAYVVIKEAELPVEEIEDIIDGKRMALYFDPVGGEKEFVVGHINNIEEAIHALKQDLRTRKPEFTTYYQRINATNRKDGELFVIDYGSWTDFYTLWREE